MKNDWISLIGRIEKCKGLFLMSIELFSDGTGLVMNDDKELYAFDTLTDLVDIVENLEKYKVLYDIIQTFNSQDFHNIEDHFNDIRRKAVKDAHKN